MGKARLPKNLRKRIRGEKARIRRERGDVKEQERLISELYLKIPQKFQKKARLIQEGQGDQVESLHGEKK